MHFYTWYQHNNPFKRTCTRTSVVQGCYRHGLLVCRLNMPMILLCGTTWPVESWIWGPWSPQNPLQNRWKYPKWPRGRNGAVQSLKRLWQLSPQVKYSAFILTSVFPGILAYCILWKLWSSCWQALPYLGGCRQLLGAVQDPFWGCILCVIQVIFKCIYGLERIANKVVFVAYL